LLCVQLVHPGDLAGRLFQTLCLAGAHVWRWFVKAEGSGWCRGRHSRRSFAQQARSALQCRGVCRLFVARALALTAQWRGFAWRHVISKK
jgi:hypothetical protein